MKKSSDFTLLSTFAMTFNFESLLQVIYIRVAQKLKTVHLGFLYRYIIHCSINTWSPYTSYTEECSYLTSDLKKNRKEKRKAQFCTSHQLIKKYYHPDKHIFLDFFSNVHFLQDIFYIAFPNVKNFTLLCQHNSFL